jgi:hypothetical protein
MTKRTRTGDTIDVAGVKALALWCREQRIVVTELQVGSVRLVMQDLGLAGQLVPNRPTDDQLRANLYQQMGGSLLEPATGAADDPRPEYDGSDEGDE